MMNNQRGPVSRIVEYVIIFCICCFLIKLGITYLLAVKIPLLLIMLALGILTTLWRTHKWREEHDDY